MIRFDRGSSRRGLVRGIGAAVLTVGFGLLMASEDASAGLFRNRANADEVAAGFPPKGDPGTAQTRTINVNGVAREYLLQAANTGRPAPIVVLLHGGQTTAEDVWRSSSLPTLAVQEGFTLVAPQAIGKHWNDGRGTVVSGTASKADDLGFLRAMIAQVIAQDQGDPKAVFMIGPSNGGFMTMYFACNSANTLRAAGNVISNLPVDLQASCRPSKPLPWLSMNGTADPIIPFGGQGLGVVKDGQPQPALLSATQTFKFWADHAGCSPQTSTSSLQAASNDTANKIVRGGCSGGTQSVEYIFNGAGHTFPGMEIKRLIFRYIVGKSSQTVDAGTVIWDFFKSTLAGGNN